MSNHQVPTGIKERIDSTCKVYRIEIYRISYRVIEIASSQLLKLLELPGGTLIPNTYVGLEDFVEGLDKMISGRGDIVTKESLKKIVISILFGSEVLVAPTKELDELINQIVIGLVGDLDLEVWDYELNFPSRPQEVTYPEGEF